MAKVKESKATGNLPYARDHLPMHLFAPGMTALHRAGLGGLACTLNYIVRAREQGLVLDEALPGAPWDGERPPWDIDERSVTLRFGKPENAREYLKHLFRIAFQIKDGVIYLPGQYAWEPSLVVRNELQLGLTLTFLQFGPHRQLSDPTPYAVDPEGSGHFITVELRRCSSFLHQDGWEELTESRTGVLKTTPFAVINAFYPGGMIRHDAFKTETRVVESAAGMLLLYFAAIGCLSLPINRGSGVLLVPDVNDLLRFAEDRPVLTPTSLLECRIGGTTDAVLQLQTRARARGAIDQLGVPACWGMKLTPTTWNKKQKARVDAFGLDGAQVALVEPEEESHEERRLHRFQVALADLAPYVVTRTVREIQGGGRGRVTIEREESYLADSVVRPLVAENLARDLPWYRDFVQVYRSSLSALQRERKGLRAMVTDDQMSDDLREATVVRAVQDALRGRFREIAQIYGDRPILMMKKWTDESNKWGRGFSGAMTADQFRKLVCDLFRRGGQNPELQERWQQLIPMLRPVTWKHARDLALIGICSYQPRREPEPDSQASDDQSP